MGQVAAFGEYLKEIWRCRYFWLALVAADLRHRYRRSLLGIAWSLLHPLAMTVILCTVFAQVFAIAPTRYAPFVFLGLTGWNFLTTVLIEGCLSFQLGEMYIRQYPAPLAIYPLRTVLAASIHLLIALAAALFVLPWFGLPVGLKTLLGLLPALGLLFTLGWSIAILGGVANVYFADTQHLAHVGLQVLFYATPIIYPPEQLRVGPMALFLRYNPLNCFLELIRAPLLTSDPAPAWAWLGSGLVTLLVLIAAIWTLQQREKEIIFQL